MNSTRNVVFDIAKGIGITLVVLGHARIPILTFLSLFHVPLFFLISGYFIKSYNYENINNIFNFIKRRLKTLWLPFFFFNTIFVLLNNLFIKINFYTTNPEFLIGSIGNKYGLAEWLSIKAIFIKICYYFIFAYNTQFGGATWFLRVLFWGSICYIVLSYCLKKIIKKDFIFDLIRVIICFVALFIGFYLSLLDFRFYGIANMCSMLIIIFIGVLYNKIEKYIKLNFFICLLSFLILIIILKYNPEGYNIAANEYTNPILLVISAISGFLFVLYISNILSKNSVLSKIFSYIGQHTISILCLHLLCFKFVTFIIVFLYNLPNYRLASFPVYNIGNWWIIYSLVGIVLPIFISSIYRRFQMKINTSRLKNEKL